MLWLALILATAIPSSGADDLVCKISHPGSLKDAVFQVAALPPQVRKSIGRMADAGKPFQYTDVIEPGNLPNQQLIYAVRRKAGWLVYSIHGGCAPSCDARFVHLDGRVENLINNHIRQ